MEIIYSTDKIENTFLKIYSKETGILKRTKYLAEFHTRDKTVKEMAELDEKILGEYIKTYKHLFEIANLPWPKFPSENLQTQLIEFSKSKLFSLMVGYFGEGRHIDFKPQNNGFVLTGNYNQFFLELSGNKGRFVIKGNPIFANVSSYWNSDDCDVQISKEQVDLFMAYISYRFNLGLLPGFIHHTFEHKVYTSPIYESRLSLYTYPDPHVNVVKLIVRGRCSF